MATPPRFLPALIPPLVTAACFVSLLRNPDWLIVDGTRPAVDRADALGTRGIGNDLTFVFMPKAKSVLSAVKSGAGLPTWDASGFGGRPLIGNPQAGMFYPPVWLAWWAGRPDALGWLTVAHLMWAGAGLYVLLRALRVAETPAGIGSGCFAACPYLMAHTFEGHLPHVWAACWYPWAFWAYLKVTRGDSIGVFSLPPVLALCFLSGHPQEWYYLVLALSVWSAVRAARLAVFDGLRAATVSLGIWVGLLGISLALSALELLPELDAQPWLLDRSLIPLRHVTRYHVHGVNLLQLISPFALGKPHDYLGHDNYWETVFSIGLIPLLIVALGSGLRRRGTARQGWIALVVVCGVLAAGRKLGLYALAFEVLPGMNRFRVPARTLFLASLGTSVLVGLSLDGMATTVRGAAFERLRKRSLAVSLGLAAGLLAVATTTIGTRAAGQPASVSIGFVTLARDAVVWGTVLSACGIAAFARDRRVFAYGMGALALIELVVTAHRLLVTSPPDTLVRPGDVAFRVVAARSKVGRIGPHRIAADPRLISGLDAATLGFELTNVNDGFQIQHAADFYERLYPFLGDTHKTARAEGAMDDAVSDFEAEVAKGVLNVLGVDVVVTARAFPRLGLDLVSTDRGGRPSWVYSNPNAMPRAYVVPRALVRSEADRDAPAAVRLSQTDLRAGVLMESDPLAVGERQSYEPAELVSGEPSRPRFRVTTSRPGLLVVGNTWMPGWTAEVDGRVEKVLRGNHWQQVVPIRGSGVHHVELRYEPPAFKAGLAVTAAANLIWWVTAVSVFAADRMRVRGRRCVASCGASSPAKVRQTVSV